jgi:hypothetical protein
MGSEALFGIVYVLSAVGCLALAAVGLKGMRADWRNVYYDTGLIPGVVGFSVFPVINTAICLVFGLWVLLKARNGE